MSEDERLDLTVKLKDILFECITEYTKEGVVQANLGSAAARDNLAIFIASYLSPKIEEYEEEIKSLWFMLDELKQSEQALKSDELKSEMTNMIKDQMAYLKFMQRQKGDA